MKKIIVSVLALSLIMSLSVPAFASDVKIGNTSDISNTSNDILRPEKLPTYLSKIGVVTEVSEGRITVENIEVSVKDSIILNITDTTCLVSGKTGEPLGTKLKVGDSVVAYYSPVMTRSLPPQSNAFAIVKYDKNEKSVGKYVTVEQIDKNEKGTRILVDNGGLWVTLSEKVDIAPFKTKNVVTVDDIKVGSELLVWYDIVLLSYPGQTQTEKVVILSTPVIEPESIKVSVQAGVMSVNGKEVNLDGTPITVKEGYTMLPLRKVVEALGYTVTWNGASNSIRLENDNKVIAISLATNEFSVGVNNELLGTYIDKLDITASVINGVTYVPHTFFESALKVVTIINTENV